jgi:hypothetical protein
MAHLGKQQTTLSPLFSAHKGKLSCPYLPQYIELSHQLVDHPLS